MAGTTDFTGLVPGFDFLQGLVRNAGAGLPEMSQWIAPTLDPQELDKRIGELRTVQFWLDQNAKLLGTTIQALEVQRLTLSTLKTMNLPLAELRKSFEMHTPPAAAEAPAAEPAPESPATAAADPMRWWGALTQQFGQIAAQALKDVAVEPPAPAPAPRAAARKAAPRKTRPAAAATPPAPRRKAAKG
jgi:hypothetical protein